MEQPIVTLIATLALLLTLGVTSASAAPPGSCRVRDTDTGQTYTALQAAVDAAKRGDRLAVRGTCHGPTVIDTGLVIGGISTVAGRALLYGDREGVVLTVRKGVAVTVMDLDIEGGRGHFGEGGPERPYNWPAGVLNHGNLTLRGVIVRRNHGLGVENTGTLRLNGHSVIGDNWGAVKGMNVHTGIHNAGTLRLNGTSTVRNNDGSANDGTLIMHGDSSANVVTNRGRMTLHDASAGRWMTNRGSLTLNDQSRVGNLVVNHARMILNDASRLSGVVINDDGATMTLHGSSAVVGSYGFVNEGTLTLNGSASIRDGHVARPCGAGGYCSDLGPIGGGGVTNRGALLLNDASSISGNSVEPSLESNGGGVYMPRVSSGPKPASLTMTGASTITGNTAGRGGGIYAAAGTVLVGVNCGPGGNVYGNTPDDCYVE